MITRSEITVGSLVQIVDKFAADWGGENGQIVTVTDVYSAGCRLEIRTNDGSVVEDVPPSNVRLITRANKV